MFGTDTSQFTTTHETYGQDGRFLASLSALSLLSLSSRHVLEQSESNIIYHYSRVLTRQQNVSEQERKVRARNGTTVVARDMFGNLPVRVKQRAAHFGLADNVERALDRLKMQITALTLAWPKPVRIVVSDHQGQQRRRFAVGKQALAGGHGQHPAIESYKTSPFRLDHICTLIANTGYIDPTSFGSWTSVSARTSQIFVRAAINLEPAPSKQIQFISLGIQPLEKSSALSQLLYQEVNRLFAESTFGTIEDDVDISEEERLRRLRDRRFRIGGYTDRQLKGRGRGVDRFPMFYMRINNRHTNIPLDILASDENDKYATKFLEKAILLVSSMVQQFLQDHHFRPRVRRRPNGRQSPGKSSKINTLPSHHSGHSSYPVQSAVRSRGDSRDHTSDAQACAHPNVVSKIQSRVSQNISSTIPFGAWSRIKVGNSRALNDLLSGLPRCKTSHDKKLSSSKGKHYAACASSLATDRLHSEPLTAEHLKEDVELLLNDLEKESEIGDSNQSNEFEQRIETAPQMTASEHDVETFEDDFMFWQNPTTGEAVAINSRTDLSLPGMPWRPSSEPQPLNSNLSILHSSRHQSLKQQTVGGRSPNLSAELRSVSNGWLGGILRSWQNPAFQLKERCIPSVDVEHLEELQTKSKRCCHGQTSHSVGSEIASRNDTLSKAALRDATVLGQVDKKFILAIMRTSETDTVSGTLANSALVLIDQHAADERCRVEDLYEEMSKGTAMLLSKPVTFEVTQQELELFRRERTHFESWGVLYDAGTDKGFTKIAQSVRPASANLLPSERLVEQANSKRPTTANAPGTYSIRQTDAADDSSFRISVNALPELVAERCRLDPKMVIGMLRSEVWARTESALRGPSFRISNEASRKDAEEQCEARSWLKRISACPRGLVELLNSRACRSAIMFNDELTKLECGKMVEKLARCVLPFQCAHGRPSMVVLGGLESSAEQLSKDDGAQMKKCSEARSASEPQRGINLDFLPAFAAWQQRGMN